MTSIILERQSLFVSLYLILHLPRKFSIIVQCDIEHSDFPSDTELQFLCIRFPFIFSIFMGKYDCTAQNLSEAWIK